MIVAVVPLKALHMAKGRLAPDVSPEERVRLMRNLVERTIDVLKQSRFIGRIALATPETELARELKVSLVEDRGSLNSAVSDSMRWATSIGASGLVVLPADLPQLIVKDIDALVSAAPYERSLAIAPTHDGGTGALFVQPPDVLPPRFGIDSFARHKAAATELGIPIYEVYRPGLASDLDTVEDLEACGLSGR
jgi:2-phospho-L-lactate guanylyltransferase